jgi:predicted amidohydrolase YtcJ
MYHRNFFVIILINLMIFLFFPVSLSSQGSWNVKNALTPDIIIYNGQIITMEQTQAQVEALAIQGDSILAVGNESDILALAGINTRGIDLGGKTVLPGFIDSHGHWIADRISDNQSEVDEVIETVLSKGWTSISELAINQESLEDLISFDQQNPLRIRVNTYLVLNHNEDRFGNWYQAYQPGYEYSPKLRIGGLKIFMDYVYGGPLWFNQTELDAMFQEAHDLGFQIATHSHSADNATDTVLNSLETVLGGQSNQNYRHRVEHLVVLRDDQIQRMADLGIIASFQLTWLNSDWADMMEDLPQDYIPLVGRWRDLLQAGVPSIGGTDYPWIISPTGDPMEGSDYSWGGEDVGSAMKAIHSAVTRIGEFGLTPPNWMVNQTISVEQALRLITIDAAYGTFQEDIKGSIKAGKLADLVVLSDNPLIVPESTLADLDVLMTMIGGVVEFCTPDYQSLCTGQNFSSTLSSSTLTTTSTTTTPALPTFITSIVLGIIYLKRKRKF